MGTAAKVASKPPWKQQKYPQTALERLRQKALEDKQKKRQEKGTPSSSKGNSFSSRVIEGVEAVSAKEYEQLKKMKKDTPRLKPAARQSEKFRRSRSYWLGKTRRVEVKDDGKRKLSRTRNQMIRSPMRKRS